MASLTPEQLKKRADDLIRYHAEADEKNEWTFFVDEMYAENCVYTCSVHDHLLHLTGRSCVLQSHYLTCTHSSFPICFGSCSLQLDLLLSVSILQTLYNLCAEMPCPINLSHNRLGAALLIHMPIIIGLQTYFAAVQAHSSKCLS